MSTLLLLGVASSSRDAFNGRHHSGSDDSVRGDHAHHFVSGFPRDFPNFWNNQIPEHTIGDSFSHTDPISKHSRSFVKKFHGRDVENVSGVSGTEVHHHHVGRDEVGGVAELQEVAHLHVRVLGAKVVPLHEYSEPLVALVLAGSGVRQHRQRRVVGHLLLEGFQLLESLELLPGLAGAGGVLQSQGRLYT
jgi:hypothetical protein